MAILGAANRVGSTPIAESASSSSITLSVPDEMMAAIVRISLESRLPIDAVFTRAIALYQASLKAIAEGKHVGYSADDDRLDVEFTGLVAPEE